MKQLSQKSYQNLCTRLRLDDGNYGSTVRLIKIIADELSQEASDLLSKNKYTTVVIDDLNNNVQYDTLSKILIYAQAYQYCEKQEQDLLEGKVAVVLTEAAHAQMRTDQTLMSHWCCSRMYSTTIDDITQD